MLKVKPSAAPRARIASRLASICSAELPYLRRRCSVESSPSAAICGFSSNGWKWISADTSPSSFASACCDDARPTAHQGQDTSETKSMRSGTGIADVDMGYLANPGGGSGAADPTQD